jgi:hypothetical protein
MSAIVLPFRRRGVGSAIAPQPPKSGFAVTLRAEAGQVFMALDAVTIGMTAVEAVVIGGELMDLGRHAGATSCPPEPGEAELRARLALLGDAVARYEAGERRASDAAALVALTRQLTAEVRR